MLGVLEKTRTPAKISRELEKPKIKIRENLRINSLNPMKLGSIAAEGITDLRRLGVAICPIR